MTQHLQVDTQNGKTRIYYKDEALSKGIEVHPQSILLAYVLISRVIYKDSARLMAWPDRLPDGLYPVSVRVKPCSTCGGKGYTEGQTLDGDDARNECLKCEGGKYAILEEIKDEHDSPILNEILSEITPEEQAKTDKEMTEKIEAPDAEKMFKERFSDKYWHDKFARDRKGFDSYDMIDFANSFRAELLSSIRREVEAMKSSEVDVIANPDNYHPNDVRQARLITSQIDAVLTLIDKHLNP